MSGCLIVGCGNIGTKLYKEYGGLNPDRYDPYKGLFEKKPGRYDLAFICVDTPMKPDGKCDLSQVETAIDETDAEVIVIRSTVVPGTTARLKFETGKEIIFCPEFYGTTQHNDMSRFDFGFTILGGNRSACDAVVQKLQTIFDARHRFCFTDSTTAELTKYMLNTMLAAKVSLCVQFWELAQKYGVDYPEMRELVLNDPRFSRAHTFVYDEHPYWESHCFDKDLPAIVCEAGAPLIQNIIDYNETCKKRYGKSVIHDC